MNRQALLFMLSLLALNAKEAIALEKISPFKYVKLATINRDSDSSKSWLVSKVISLPQVNLEREVRPSKSPHHKSESIPSQNRTYKIAPGDTLEILAHKFQTTVSQLASSNGIKNPNQIFVGQTLVIPKAKGSSNNEKSVLPVATTSDPEKMEEINVNALVERQKDRSLPLPLPIRRKNFSSSGAARSLQMGELGAPPNRPLKANTGGLSKQVATVRLHESKKILG